jgi:hypothetical protein
LKFGEGIGSIGRDEQPCLRLPWREAKSGFADKANPTHLKTESDAYLVNITMGQAKGFSSLSAQRPGGTTSINFWNSDKSYAENLGKRTNMIKAFYPNWAAKAFGEHTNGGGK